MKLYGTHCFHVVVASEDETLALEVKLLRSSNRGKAKANGSFQRFVGQCLLAGLIHKRVVGFCVAEEGALDWAAQRDMQAFSERGIKLTVRQVQVKAP